MNVYSDEVVSEKVGAIGFVTLNRPKALNALSLPMVRELTHVLRGFQNDANVLAVVIRGSNKEGPFGAFCAGGDIRYFHQAALSGDASLEDFFTEEYNLNHIIHTYGKPFIALMDGIVMGGGMGLSQGIALRVVTERTQMAMPETQIGLFPDVGGGYFLSRCPGNTGEYLALTGQLLRGAEALSVGLADVCMASEALPALWNGLQSQKWTQGDDVVAWVKEQASTHAVVDANSQANHGDATRTASSKPAWWDAQIDNIFRLPTVTDMVNALSQLMLQQPEGWAAETLKALRQRSPLLLAVSLEQIRRGRTMGLADELRMERDMVRHCFHADHLERRGAQTDTAEGIRALVIDKDRQPKWLPASIEEITPDMVQPFFQSPWPSGLHPLRHLVDAH
jgi:enoyl-CoA hydratase/carnithine racemase